MINRCIYALSVFLLTSFLAPCIAEQPMVVFLVRHAEKASTGRDPALTDEGHARAKRLADLLRDVNITSIYTTNYQRTKETAAPLAKILKVDPTIYDPSTLAPLAERLRTQGGRCLVVGHSNTTPELVKLLGGAAGEPIEEATEFDRLYMLQLFPNGVTSTVVLRN